MDEPHVSGTKSFARLAHEETSLQAIASNSSNTQGSNTLGFVDDLPNDDYSKVKGPKKRGYIRCVGRMPTVKEKMSCSTSTVPCNSNSVNQRASSESHHNDGNHFYELLSFLCSYKYSLFVLSVIIFIF
uniref:Uncharacterized protein n=1 Tax=Lactuca sativa TaxID=4236 RepID=A0A9R1W2R3_LACSA|nr:hypothetical protein LSAT_V11C300107000 [Lactuca sativa]